MLDIFTTMTSMIFDRQRAQRPDNSATGLLTEVVNLNSHSAKMVTCLYQRTVTFELSEFWLKPFLAFIADDDELNLSFFCLPCPCREGLKLIRQVFLLEVLRYNRDFKP